MDDDGIDWARIRSKARARLLLPYLTAHVPRARWNGLRNAALHNRPLLSEAVCWGERRVVAALLLNGADLEATDGFGETPAHFCVRYWQPDALELLIAAGADVGRRDLASDRGRTPLDIALQTTSCQPCVRVLLINGQRLANVHPTIRPYASMPSVVAIEEDTTRCRAVTRVLLGIKKCRHARALERLDRFVVRLIAFQIWATRGGSSHKSA